jgi:putative ABC transport system permease protein
MTAFALACRSTSRYRLRAVLAIVGVAVIGALLFDMLLLSRGLLVSFSDLLGREGFDVRVVAGQGLARIPIPKSAALAASVATMPEVADLVLVRTEDGEAARGRGPAQRVTLVGRTPSRTSPWTMVEGQDLPAAAGGDTCPAVINRALGEVTGVAIGDTIRVTATPGDEATALPAIDCRVTGVADFGFASASTLTIATSMTAFPRAVGEREPGDAEVLLIATRPESDRDALVRAVARLRPDLRVYSNAEVVAQFDRNGFAYFRQISTVLSTLTTAFAFLLVTTLLTVSINQRLGEIAALRALGISRRRIAAMLWWESALLVGVGALAALPIGGALAVVLDRILRQMPGLPAGLHFFVFEPRALVLHLLVFTLTACLAAAYPIWLAARLPIAATLRREVVG